MKRIGARLSPYGKIVAIGSLSGERYYWFIDEHGAVAMLPAAVVEAP